MQEMERKNKIHSFPSMLPWRGHLLSQLHAESGQMCERCHTLFLSVNMIAAQLQLRRIFIAVCCTVVVNNLQDCVLPLLYYHFCGSSRTPGCRCRWQDVSYVFMWLSLFLFCYHKMSSVGTDLKIHEVDTSSYKLWHVLISALLEDHHIASQMDFIRRILLTALDFSASDSRNKPNINPITRVNIGNVIFFCKWQICWNFTFLYIHSFLYFGLITIGSKATWLGWGKDHVLVNTNAAKDVNEFSLKTPGFFFTQMWAGNCRWGQISIGFTLRNVETVLCGVLFCF